MKTSEEKYNLAEDYMLENCPDKEDGTYRQYQVKNAFCKGFDEGYDEGVMDGQGDLTSILARTRALFKKAEKVGLHFSLDLSFRYETAQVTIYEVPECGSGLGDRVFHTPDTLISVYRSITMGHIKKYLDDAEEFINKYTCDKENNLEKRVATLSAELSGAKKELRKVKNANKKKTEDNK